MTPKHDHSAAIAKVRAVLPEDERLKDLGRLFKVFGDPTRIKILYSLLEEDLCVCAIAELLDMEQSAISHQLRILRNAKLVTSRRDGKTNIYSLADAHVHSIIGQGYEHLMEEST